MLILLQMGLEHILDMLEVLLVLITVPSEVLNIATGRARVGGGGGGGNIPWV